MAVTYDITNHVGTVRLKIGDTDIDPTTDAVFTDEELTVFLTDNSSNINLASADALEAWAAKYAASPASEKIGDYAYTQKTVDNMLKQAKSLRDIDAATPVFEWAEMDLTGEEE